MTLARALAIGAVGVFATACRSHDLPTGPTPEGGPLPSVIQSVVALTHECNDTIVIKNNLSGPGSSTLYRWRAKASGPYDTAPLVGTDTVRIANASGSGPGYTRIAMPSGATQLGLHYATGPDTLYRLEGVARNPNPPVCGARVPLRVVAGPGSKFYMSPQVDSLLVGATFGWYASAQGDADSIAVQVNGTRDDDYEAIVDSTMEAVLLTASAYWPEETLLPAAADFITDLRAILASGDPKAAAQELLHDMTAYALAQDTATVHAVLGQVAGRAFDWETELDEMFRLDSLLAGAVFDLSPGGPSVRAVGPSDSLSEPTRVVLVNGVFTSERSLTEASQVAAKLLAPGSPALTLSYFLNPSLDRDPLDACLVAIQSATQLRVAVSRFIRTCLPLIGGIADIFDPVESVSQMLHRLVPSVVPPRAISLRLADSVQAFREAGAHTIILGHSQGTQLSREAVQELYSSGRYLHTRDSVCLGAIAMGGPQGGGWDLPTAYLDEFAATGDLVSSLASEVDEVPTALSVELALANAAAVTPLEVFINTVVYGIRIHSLGNNYLRDAATTSRLQASVAAIRRECEPGSVVSDLTTWWTIHRGDQFFPSLYFKVYNQNGRRIYGRTIRIESSDSSVVDISPSRQAMAVGHGSTELVGTSGLASDSIEATVTAVPDLSVGGARAGHWFVTGPLIQDSLALSGLVQLDSVTAVGQYLVTGGSVSYQYSGTPYTTPVLNARINPGGTSPTLQFSMATPEYPSNPYGYADVTLTLQSSGAWAGGAILYYSPGLVREGRGWVLNAPD